MKILKNRNSVANAFHAPCLNKNLTSRWFKAGRVHVCIVFLLNKSRYKNKCGGDLSNTPIANSFQISPPTCCTTSTVCHAKEQDKWDLEMDGRTFGSTKPTLISLSSFFFLFKRWFVRTHSSYSLSLWVWLNLMLITKTELNKPWQSSRALHALHDKLAYSLFLNFHLVLVN